MISPLRIPDGGSRGQFPRESSRARLIRETAVAALFCVIFAGMVLSFCRSASPTYDEVAFLPAGYSYLRWHDYRMSPEHPPLTKELAALPLLWRHDWPREVDLSAEIPVTLPLTNSEAALRWSWTLSLDTTTEENAFGHTFLYGLRPEALQRLNRQDPGIVGPAAVPPTLPLNRADFYNDVDGMFFWGRLPILLLGVALAVLVFCWARELFGFAGGVLSLALFCFDPNFIAHSGLVTTDVGEAMFFFGAVYFLWRTCRQWTAFNVAGFLVFFSLAFAAKFSAVLLLPIFWLVTAAWIFSRPISAGRKETRQASSGVRAGRLAGLFAAGLALTYGVIWASYSFRYSAAVNPSASASVESQMLGQSEGEAAARVPYRTPGQLRIEAAVRGTAALRQIRYDQPATPMGDEQIAALMANTPVGLSGQLILFAQRHHLLPEAFIYGFARGQMDMQLRSSYLLGQYSSTGFYSYFPWAFLLKTPLPALILVLTSLGLAFARHPIGNPWLPFLVLPAGLYFAVAMGSHLNIGQRHLLPVYPFLYVLAGSLVLDWARYRQPVRRGLAAAVLLPIAVSSQIVFYPLNHRPAQPVAPHYLAYFNELAGGPGNGYRALVDSNLDWGQDLQALKRWLDENKITDPIYLCYFGMADPRYYGIVHYNLPGGLLFEPQSGLDSLKPGGVIVISATHREGVYFTPAGREAWRQILEHSTPLDTIGYSLFLYRFNGLDNAAPAGSVSTLK